MVDGTSFRYGKPNVYYLTVIDHTLKIDAITKAFIGICVYFFLNQMFGYFIFLVMAKPCLSVAVVSFVAHTELFVLTHWSCSRCKVTEADLEFDPRGCSRCQG